MQKMVLVFFLLLIAGCGTRAATDSMKAESAEYRPRQSAQSNGDGEGAFLSMGGGTAPEQQQAETTIEGELDSVERKIIYTATIELVVSQFDGLEKRIQQTIKDCNGYLARVNLGRMQGERRSGSWTARIPTDKYDQFLEAIAALGVPVSQQQDAQDVTEEFVDLTARITNQKKLEKRILELLDRPDDKIQHVIEVEKELARVREAIERMEGRIRYLADQTDMTTVVINAREERDYQPPQAPSLDNRVASAWSTSIANTKTALGNLLVSLVGSLIPILFWIVGLLVFWFAIGKRQWRKFRAQLGRSESNSETSVDEGTVSSS